MALNTSITPMGGVEDGRTNLTGSSTLVEIQGGYNRAVTSVIVDFGAYQGSHNDHSLNKEFDKRLLKARYLVLTHSHMDHCGRIPLLVKNGFRGEIFMTKTTRDASIEVLKDSIRISQENIEIEKAKRDRELNTFDINVQISGLGDLYLKGNGIKNNHGPRRRLNPEDKVPKDKTVAKLKKHLKDGETIEELLSRVKSYFEDIRKRLCTPGEKLEGFGELKKKLEESLREIPELLFDEKDVIKMQGLIKIVEPGNIVNLITERRYDGAGKKIDMEFFHSGHMEGGVSVQLKAVSTSVRKILYLGKSPRTEEEYSTQNLWFSGDLGRFRDPNLSGSPEIPKDKLDFCQIESTYAGINHPSRGESESVLFNSILRAPGDVVIPEFAQQRRPEIEALLLKFREESENCLKEIQKLNMEIDALDEEIKKIEADLSESDRRKRIRIDKLEADIGKKEGFIKMLSNYLIDYTVLMDGQLGVKTDAILLENNPENYGFLSPEWQQKVFGEVIIEVLEERDRENLYDYIHNRGNDDKKLVIPADGGMCLGGSVMKHLEENLENPKSTIIFMGFTPEGTIGWRIKRGLDVEINGNIYSIKCKVIDISGFSAHIDEQDILWMISQMNLGENATIALNHGGERRAGLAGKIRVLENIKEKNIKVELSEVGSTIKI